MESAESHEWQADAERFATETGAASAVRDGPCEGAVRGRSALPRYTAKITRLRYNPKGVLTSRQILVSLRRLSIQDAHDGI
jgi:hypothetical protein